MKVVAIVPLRRKSGLTYYSSKLYSRLPAELIDIEQPLHSLLNKILHSKADIYHLQFEYQVLGSAPVSWLISPILFMLISLKGKLIVTVHGLVSNDAGGQKNARLPRFLVYLGYVTTIKLSAIFVKSFIVHSKRMKEVMERYGIPRVTVIPHGTDNVSSVDEIADHNRIIFFGFVRPSKGVDTLILALEGIKKVCNDVKLTIAGSIPFGKEAYYLGLLKSLIDQHGLHDAVEFITKFLTPQEIRQLLSGATVVVLPYRDEFVEVSGVAHDIAGFGISLVCSNTPRFSEFIDGFDCIKVDLTPDSLAHALTKLLSNRELREKLGKNIRLRATSESWDKVSAMHTDLYRQILEGC